MINILNWFKPRLSGCKLFELSRMMMEGDIEEVVYLKELKRRGWTETMITDYYELRGWRLWNRR